MALRIFKYSVGGALRHSLLASDAEITIDFPKPCVVFLKSGPDTPKQLTWKINFFDDQEVKLAVPTLRLAELSVQEMAGCNLFPVGQFFLRTFEPLTKSKLDGFREAAQSLMAELKSAVEVGVIPAHIGLKMQDNIRRTAESIISRSKLEGVDLAMASSVMETLEVIDYDDVFRQLEERGRNEGRVQGIAQGRNALAAEMAVTAFRQRGKMQEMVVTQLKSIGISEQIINEAKALVQREKASEPPTQKRGHLKPDR